MHIDVVFDLCCPWCRVGQLRLQEALARRPGINAVVRWRTFVLNPDMPSVGLPFHDYLAWRFNGRRRAERTLGAAADAARAYGEHFRYDRIERMPSTIKAHRLVRLLARDPERQERLVDRLFRAMFVEGRDIGDARVLADIADATGILAAERTAAFLAGEKAERAVVLADHARSTRLGIMGLPTFVFGGRYSIAGAQEPEVLERLIDLASRIETAAEPAMSMTGPPPWITDGQG